MERCLLSAAELYGCDCVKEELV
jgi:hypothetical protein